MVLFLNVCGKCHSQSNLALFPIQTSDSPQVQLAQVASKNTYSCFRVDPKGTVPFYMGLLLLTLPEMKPQENGRSTF